MSGRLTPRYGSPALRTFRSWHRTINRYRRWLAALLSAATVLLMTMALKPAPMPAMPVFTAVRDLPAGTKLTSHDVRLRALPSNQVPAGALTSLHDPAGEVLAGPIRRGETLTDVRVIGPGLLDRESGRVAAPARIADAGSVRLLSVGDVVDVLAASASSGASGRARVVADYVRILAIPATAPGDGAGGLGGGALVVLAVDPETARQLAAAAATDTLSVVLRDPEITPEEIPAE